MPMVAKLGVDVEFELAIDGKIRRALREHSLFIHKSDNGYDNSPVFPDGSGDSLEFRPAPGSPDTVVENLRQLFYQFKSKAQSYDGGVRLLVTGNRYPLGCHVHMSFLDKLDSTMISKIVKHLDYYVGRLLLPLSGSQRGRYRILSAWREQSYYGGAMSGFEYRTLPAAVALRPEILRTVLQICKLAVEKSDTAEVSGDIASPTSLERLGVENVDTLFQFVQTYWTIRDKDVLKYWLSDDKRGDVREGVTVITLPNGIVAEFDVPMAFLVEIKNFLCRLRPRRTPPRMFFYRIDTPLKALSISYRGKVFCPTSRWSGEFVEHPSPRPDDLSIGLGNISIDELKEVSKVISLVIWTIAHRREVWDE